MPATTVTWTNDDNFTHTVQVDGQDDHKVERGKSVSITFDKPGTYHYVCTLHSQDMDGDGDRQVITRAAIERDVVILACAISAGIHAALVPDHFAEGTAPGAGFAIAAALLLAARRCADATAVSGCGARRGGGLSAACSSATASLLDVPGYPCCIRSPEPIEALAVVTKASSPSASWWRPDALRDRPPSCSGFVSL